MSVASAVLKRRHFLTVASAAAALPLFFRNSIAQGSAGASSVKAMAAPTPESEGATQLRKRNIATINKWLSFSGVTRHKNRLTVYTEDFISGNPAETHPKKAFLTRADIALQAQAAEEHPEHELFQEWGFYDARIYAAVDRPDLFNVNCLGRGRVVLPEHPEGFVYQNQYTHYFRLQDGLIQVWWETVVDPPDTWSHAPWDNPDRTAPTMVTFEDGQ